MQEYVICVKRVIHRNREVYIAVLRLKTTFTIGLGLPIKRGICTKTMEVIAKVYVVIAIK